MGFVANPFMPSQRRQRPEDFFEVEANLVYTVRYRTVRVLKRNPVSKKSGALWHKTLIPSFQRQRKAHANL